MKVEDIFVVVTALASLLYALQSPFPWLSFFVVFGFFSFVGIVLLGLKRMLFMKCGDKGLEVRDKISNAFCRLTDFLTKFQSGKTKRTTKR